MFRDLKEYQNLQKLYEERVSKEVKESILGGPVKPNIIKPVAKSNIKVNNNSSSNTNKKIDTTFDSTKIIKNALDQKNNKGFNLKDMNKYSPTKKFDSNTFKDTSKQAAADKKEVEFRLKNTESSEQSAKAETAPEKRKLTGKERAQQMAKDRIKSGKTIADVKKANTDAMRERARKKFQDFKAKREAKRLARMKKEEFSSYDIVLEYLLSTEQAATIEEANYVMTEMDAETIQGIVEEQKKNLNEIRLGTVAKVVVPAAAGLGLLGQMGKKQPIEKSRQDFQMDYKLKKLSGTGDSPETRNMLGIPLDYKLSDEQKKKYKF